MVFCFVSVLKCPRTVYGQVVESQGLISSIVILTYFSCPVTRMLWGILSVIFCSTAVAPALLRWIGIRKCTDQSLHPTLTHRIGTVTVTPWSTASTCWLNYVRVIRNVSWSVKVNASPQPTSAKWPLASCQPGCRGCDSEINSFTSGWRNFWEEEVGNLNIPSV